MADVTILILFLNEIASHTRRYSFLETSFWFPGSNEIFQLYRCHALNFIHCDSLLNIY